jgi:hypothetical protein
MEQRGVSDRVLPTNDIFLTDILFILPQSHISIIDIPLVLPTSHIFLTNILFVLTQSHLVG